MIKQLLGQRIKEIRKSKKLTQEQLAEYVNLETSSISNIENGRYFPTAENLDKIIQTLGISPMELFTIESFKPNSILLEEMISSMSNNEKLTKLMYQFYTMVKYNL